MLAFVIKNRALAAVRKPFPRLRNSWALVRVRLAGICNTDVEILRGYHDFRGTPGHEFVGEVVDVRGVSRATKNKWLGRRVAGEINIACAALGFHPLRILPPRNQDALRPPQSPRNIGLTMARSQNSLRCRSKIFTPYLPASQTSKPCSWSLSPRLAKFFHKFK